MEPEAMSGELDVDASKASDHKKLESSQLVDSNSMQTPTVYGELSILGYNGYIPNVERNSRKNMIKYLLCKRAQPNGIKKSRHYIVKQPQATKAIHDKDLHSISFTFSRSQTIIVEYGQDENTDMFQIGRSSEDPIDFVVLDTIANYADQSAYHHSHASRNHNNNNHHHYQINANNHSHQNPSQLRNENASGSRQQIVANDIVRLNRFQRHLAKVGEELMHYAGANPNFAQEPPTRGHRQSQAHGVLLNYPQPNISNLPPVMAEHFRNQEFDHRHFQHDLHSSSSHVIPQTTYHLMNSVRATNNNNNIIDNNQNSNIDPRNSEQIQQDNHCGSRHNMVSKRSHATQSTISRFACRIIVDRQPPYTARVYAAGFDSSKNIFLGEKATKWEQNNTIDGLTTNGVLIMHQKNQDGSGGVWREVSVDGGIYAIRETRSAAQKGTRIENESNILQDGTLIDLCGATLLWRSVDGFRSSPTKKTLEEKIDLLNATRPQCPVGLNTLIIPRKPILPNNQHHHHHRHKDHHQTQHNLHPQRSERSSHEPYVYLKCGHVQGYHDWGTTEKSNQRTCPICLSVGTVAKLSMGLEPSFYIDSGPLTHVFNPCGHMASEKTVDYWCSTKIPHGTHFFHSICPFCATPLATSDPPSTRLIFQDDLD